MNVLWLAATWRQAIALRGTYRALTVEPRVTYFQPGWRLDYVVWAGVEFGNPIPPWVVGGEPKCDAPRPFRVVRDTERAKTAACPGCGGGAVHGAFVIEECS
jgi:hypothetical protein